MKIDYENLKPEERRRSWYKI